MLERLNLVSKQLPEDVAPTLGPDATGVGQVFWYTLESDQMNLRDLRTLQDCSPMSGFDNAKVDEEFFAAGKELAPNEQEFFTTGHVKSNFLCNLGYGDDSKLFPRLPRLEFSEACWIL